MTITLEAMLKSLDRELVLRRNVYRKRIAEGRMRPEEARREYATMLAIRICIADLLEGRVVVQKEIEESRIADLLTP
ncbi:hypothetical protein [Meiothermus granaticius]|uniref:Uncharacterized protein n=1 Tax=Meiothermus granaticius NBRC 107808 TaxID=1227551 RepID=A0A399F5Y9_9DEIN|nr:hypothetical protein [Meiothermus granaticius]RIH90689.1 hypothetical protein Mgrana_03201 [Meiothermus granaticius NBRC 107808]GEM88471.1 hypothetical protein MGR01S_30960 [Meiothermus granaticius NBRC 107808]